MKTIIACTDFSPIADNAVQYAAALASEAKARLVLFHHFNYPVPATDFPTAFPTIFVEEIESDHERKLQALKAELLKNYTIDIECIVRSWSLSSDLDELFYEQEADLVVMGIHGQSALVNALSGSVTSSAIRRGNLPLLVIPKGVEYRPLKKILFACDDAPIPSPDTLVPLRTLALAFDAYIEIFTLFDLEKTPELVPQARISPAKIKLNTLLEGTRHGYSYENEEVVDKGILYEAERSAADMVVMIPHHHSFLSTLLNQSETQRVAASIHLPLLVLGEKVVEIEN